MEAHLQRLVWTRAESRCEYCRMPSTSLAPTFHVEHIIAKQHGGADVSENLALACDRCNSYKGTNLTGIDPDSQAIVTLFHPRKESWEEHFEIVGNWIVGRTATGRATVRLLHMNHFARRAMRGKFIDCGEF